MTFNYDEELERRAHPENFESTEDWELLEDEAEMAEEDQKQAIAHDLSDDFIKAEPDDSLIEIMCSGNDFLNFSMVRSMRAYVKVEDLIALNDFKEYAKQ